MVLLIKKQHQLHPGIVLTDVQKNNSLQAAQLMFLKHSEAESEQASAVEAKVVPKGLKKTVAIRKRPVLKRHNSHIVDHPKTGDSLTKVRSSTPVMDARSAALKAHAESAENEKVSSSVLKGKSSVSSKMAAALAQGTYTELEKEAEVQVPKDSTLNSRKAAALAHINLANMEREWDLPLNPPSAAITTTYPLKKILSGRNGKNKQDPNFVDNISTISNTPRIVDTSLQSTSNNNSKENLYLTVPNSISRINSNNYNNSYSSSGIDISDNASINSQRNDVVSILSSSSVSNDNTTIHPNDGDNISYDYKLNSNIPYNEDFSFYKCSMNSNDFNSRGNSNNSANSFLSSNTYGFVNKVSGGNVKYEGTLPDLIPKHTRQHSRQQSKVDKIKNKIFKGHDNSSYSGLSKDYGYSPSITSFEVSNRPQSSITINNISEDKNGKAIVRTKLNNRLKTTMRQEEESNDNSNLTRNGVYSSNNPNILSYDEFGNPMDENYLSSSENSEYESASSSNGNEKKHSKKMKRRDRIKNKLKKTTSAIPYPYHHSNHSHHYLTHTHIIDSNTNSNIKKFNEDKPWKSHNESYYVTDQERKRYEAMWVSNRFLYLHLLPWWGYFSDTGTEDVSISNNPLLANHKFNIKSLPEGGLMLNLVAKDIWMRSSLPNDTLISVYNLVDLRKDGTLDRNSFIVGMWLIDQCLYGRKLPKTIDQTLWDSVDKYIGNIMGSGTSAKAIKKSKKKLIKKEIKHIKKEMKSIHL